MEIRSYIGILWRRKWVIVATAIVTVTVVVIGMLIMTPVYAASAMLRVLTPSGGTSDWIEYNTMYAERLTNTYAKIATTRPVLQELAQRLGLDQLPKIEVETLADTELLLITAEATDPTLARDAANGLAEILLEQYELARVREGMPANMLSVVEPAIAPKTPSRPRKMLNLALACMVGLGGGTGLAFAFEILDTTLHTAKQIETTTGLSALGKIPSARRRRAGFFNGNSPQAEAFRHLRTKVFALDTETPFRTLLVTSAEPREGKSTIVANLASAIAQSGRRVVVVDGDMRLPTLHKVFDLPNEIGLSTVLQEEVPLDEALQSSDIPGVWVLTSGPPTPNAAELLALPPMRASVEQLAQQFDIVLLDAPSILTVTDAALLALVADGVILVVARAQAREEAVQAACQQLSDIKARSIGVVVNRAKPDSTYAYYRHRPRWRS